MPAQNLLSMLGRMSYGAHLALYPILGGSFYVGYTSYSASSALKEEAAESLPLKNGGLPKAVPVDPDCFQPFSAIPFHNNPELKYRYATLKMHGYVDPKTQMNLENYHYKTYFDVYDHDGKKAYHYNWINMVPSHNA